MNLEDIVSYWQGQRRTTRGWWAHPDDENILETTAHSFNLDFPVSPYVGDILRAEVLILGANAGYHPAVTPSEFVDDKAVQAYLRRVANPSSADWSSVSSYYSAVNCGPLVAGGQAVLINACAYRSPRISEESDNRKLIRRLPSAVFARRWLLEGVLPLVRNGQRIVVVKRPGLWELPADFRAMAGVTFDPVPISPQLTAGPWAAVQAHLHAQQAAAGLARNART